MIHPTISQSQLYALPFPQQGLEVLVGQVGPGEKKDRIKEMGTKALLHDQRCTKLTSQQWFSWLQLVTDCVCHLVLGRRVSGGGGGSHANHSCPFGCIKLLIRAVRVNSHKQRPKSSYKAVGSQRGLSLTNSHMLHIKTWHSNSFN